MSNICNGKNCGSVDGADHSDDCIQEHDDVVNPEKAIIRKAIEKYCEEVRDPRKAHMMIVNAKDMMEWLLNYSVAKYSEIAPPEIFPGTREALGNLGIRSHKA
jgi:hypothetical protein